MSETATATATAEPDRLAAIEASIARIAEVLAKPRRRDVFVWTANEADAAMRKRDGTARAWWLAGRIRGMEVPGPGRRGKVLLVSRVDIERETIGEELPS